MEAKDSTIIFLKGVEGVRYVMYKDSAGLPSIGIGHKINLKTEAYLLTKELNNDQVNALLLADLKPVIDCVNTVVHQHINQNQFDALCAFAFNVGRRGLQTSTLLKRINANDNQKNISSAFMMWDKEHRDGVLVEDAGLIHRRQAEINLYFKI